MGNCDCSTPKALCSNAPPILPISTRTKLALLRQPPIHMLWLMNGRLLGICALLLLCSCGPSATEGGFDAPNPAARSVALERAVRTGDLSAVPKIVQLLDSDDPAIRMLAIDALQRLTGETYGYRHHDPSYVRQAAIQQWVTAVKSGDVPQLAESTIKSPHDP